MLDVRAFAEADLGLMTPQFAQAAELSRVDWRAMALDAARSGPAWTAWYDGDVLGVGGVSVLWRGRGNAWCIVTPEVPRGIWPAVHKAVSDRLENMQANGLRRIEAQSMAAFAPGNRWLRLLGFAHEGLARGYGPGGEDFNLYARVA